MTRGRPAINPAVAYCVHDDHWFLGDSLRASSPFGPVFVFVSETPWHGQPGDWRRSADAAESAGAEVVLGRWADESAQRRAAMKAVGERDFTHLAVFDSDEIPERSLLEALLAVAKADLADVVEAEMDTYWHSTEYVVRPREALFPAVMVRLGGAEHAGIRQYMGARRLRLSDGHGVLHHLSYCGPDERIARKLETWSHRDEVVPGWWRDKWQGWKSDRTLRDLHPTHPACYGLTERIFVPEALADIPVPSRTNSPAANGKLEKWPSVSVCVPLHGGEAHITRCLESLQACRDLLAEVIVVDNASPDGAANVVRKHDWVRLIENKENLGFARASNQAYQASNGDVVLFLNSDTYVPRTGLVRLVSDLMGSGTVGAAGPVTNNSGHFQRIDTTYTSFETIELFAQDLETSGKPCRETDMLVGFCLAVKRAVLEEVGAFDESFGLGFFEDNDLCHRLRRAGYRLLISDRAFVHHHGSGTMSQAGFDGYSLLRQNEAKYRHKWRMDLETGYASHLAGLAADRVAFDESRKPERLLAECRARAGRADVSLCMIVKDEERVIGECLKSAEPFFREMIVVDTGSSDGTREIARSFGAKVHDHPWERSFADARNHSLAHAQGKWLFWMDADDTLPLSTGIALQEAALSAAADLAGFIVPVQFVNEGQNAGTRVDHVKLFRNRPGVRFEGRIHEQVLPSLRQVGGRIGRLTTPVLHSGYDTSPEGQAKKRKRDRELLALDFFERRGHPFVLFNLGMTAHYNGQHRKAVRWLRRSVAHAGPRESHLRKAYALLAVSLHETGLDSEALWTLTDGLKSVGDDPELHFQAALLHTRLGNLNEAARHYQLVLGCDVEASFNSFDIGILGFKTHHNLARVLREMGRISEAVAHYKAAMEGSCDFAASAEELFDLALEARDWNTARACVDRVNAVYGLEREYCELASRLCEAQEGIGGRLRLFTHLATTRPGLIQPRLFLAKACLDAGQTPRAVAILTELERAGVAEAAYYLGIQRLRVEDLQGARDHVLEALRLNPGHRQTADTLRAVNRALGMPEEADLVQ